MPEYTVEATYPLSLQFAVTALDAPAAARVVQGIIRSGKTVIPAGAADEWPAGELDIAVRPVGVRTVGVES